MHRAPSSISPSAVAAMRRRQPYCACDVEHECDAHRLDGGMHVDPVEPGLECQITGVPRHTGRASLMLRIAIVCTIVSLTARVAWLEHRLGAAQGDATPTCEQETLIQVAHDLTLSGTADWTISK